jgi:hypothetical protein
MFGFTTVATTKYTRGMNERWGPMKAAKRARWIEAETAKRGTEPPGLPHLLNTKSLKDPAGLSCSNVFKARPIRDEGGRSPAATAKPEGP